MSKVIVPEELGEGLLATFSSVCLFTRLLVSFLAGALVLFNPAPAQQISMPLNKPKRNFHSTYR